MKNITVWIERITLISPDTQMKILSSLIILFIIWIIYRLTLKVLNRKIQKVQTFYYWRKTVNYFSVIMAIVLIGRIWFSGFQSIMTYLGLLTAGLTIALKDLITNVAGWLFIIWRHPFKVGDRIQIGEHAGDVIDLEIFMFTILEIGNWVGAEQSTGRMIQLPNNIVFNTAVANYTRGFRYIWNEISVLITFESDWQKAKKLLLDIVTEKSENATPSMQRDLKAASRKFMIYFSKLDPIVYTTVKDSGVELTLRYLCDPYNRRGSEQLIWETILKEFARHTDIDFAYPTQRFYNHAEELKK